MKRLITVSDVEKAVANKKSLIMIDSNTLVTPAARDMAKAKGVALTEGSCQYQPHVVVESQNDMVKTITSQPVPHGEQLLDAIKSILLNKIEGCPESGEKKTGKFQIVPASCDGYEVFDTGVPGTHVEYKEVVSASDSPNISSGFLKIIQSSFPWKVLCDEMDIVLEGAVSVTIDGVKRVAHAGDVIYIPPNSEVIWGAEEYAKLFYVTYPANWAELNA